MNVDEVRSMFMRVEEAAQAANISVSGYRKLMLNGLAPKPVLIGSASMLVRSEVAAWLKSYQRYGRWPRDARKDDSTWTPADILEACQD